jgi:hypothetical protein
VAWNGTLLWLLVAWCIQPWREEEIPGKFRSNQACITILDKAFLKWLICPHAELSRNLTQEGKETHSVWRQRGQALSFCFITHRTSAGHAKSQDFQQKWLSSPWKVT